MNVVQIKWQRQEQTTNFQNVDNTYEMCVFKYKMNMINIDKVHNTWDKKIMKHSLAA